MSRGDGTVMRRVSNQATDDWQTVAQLAGPTRSDVEATRRACKRLVAQRRLESNYIQRDGTPGLWSEVMTKCGYEPGARPSHPIWQFAVRRHRSTTESGD